ncbi:MAG: family 10 glycosylhydrolase [Cyanobacteria bacterium J06632_22]
MANSKRQKFLRRLALFLVALWLTLWLWQAPVVTPVATQQIRGVWMTNVGAALMYYTTRLDEVAATLAQHQINTLYPCVWNRGYTLHPSGVAVAAGGARQEPTTNLPLYPPILGSDDPLQGLVHQAHRQHLRILPWFEYGLMIPATSPIAQAHPDWLTTTREGATVASPLTAHPRLPQGLKNFQLETTGGNLAWLNPVHPEVQQFLTDLIAEVVTRYPVDGIQLDDHFGLPIAFGYDPYTVAQYRASHNDTPPPTDPNNAEWVAWRAGHITALMAKISQAVKQANSAAIVSVSPNPPAFAYRKYLQDWRTWVDQDLVDEVVVQVYRSDLDVLNNDLYNSGFYDLRKRLPVAIGLYTGPFSQAKSIERLAEEIALVQTAGYQGVSMFCWETTLGWFKGGSTKKVKKILSQTWASN